MVSRRRRGKGAQIAGGLQKLASIWSLRVLLMPKAFNRFMSNKDSWRADRIFRLLDLDHLIDLENNSQNELKIEIKNQLVARLKEVKKSLSRRSGHFFCNLKMLSDMVHLNPCERDVLTFALLVHEEDGLNHAAECLGHVSISNLFADLSIILGYKQSNLRSALEPNGALRSSGLIELDRNSSMSIPDRFEPLSGLFNAIHETSQGNIKTVFANYFCAGSPTRLNSDDFPHLQYDLDILYPYLKAVQDNRQSGVNILLYGSPGTGKTELVRMVARDLEVPLYEVSNEYVDYYRGEEDENPGKRRLRSYRLCQHLFSRYSKCLILFDEVEDIFPLMENSLFGVSRRSGEQKGLTNHLLETNPVPSIWISNSIEQIDPAFLRRFDLVFEVPVPPRQVRRQLLDRLVGRLQVGEKWLSAMAENESLAPGHIERAVKVASTLNLGGQESTEQTLSRLINNTHKAMGLRKTISPWAGSWHDYDLSYLNTDCNLEGFINSCLRLEKGRVCLYGPPGTGKTLFVNHLGNRLGKSVMVRKASDILGSFVGETERRIAGIFREAAEGDDILFLDEADSFLQDRSMAHHSWEVTQVNELLVQMEAFKGLLFCATNLMDVLDGAVFRRFDLKIKFDYLRHDQACELFRKVLNNLDHSGVEEDTWKSRLKSLTMLTPGDFATARNRLTLTNLELNAESLLQALEQEYLAKPGRSRYAIGFRT